MGFWNEPPGLSVSCDRFNRIEQNLSAYMDISELAGYQVWLKADESFYDPWYRNVGGFTQCETREFVVGSSRTVYAHEAIHAIQHCKTEAPNDEGQDPSHGDWIRKGYFDIIERVSE